MFSKTIIKKTPGLSSGYLEYSNKQKNRVENVGFGFAPGKRW